MRFKSTIHIIITISSILIFLLGCSSTLPNNVDLKRRDTSSPEDVERVNNKINELLLTNNVSIDAFYFCNAHPEFSTPEECKCRKPSPKLVFEAAEDFDIELSASYFVGDNVSDIECGKNAGLRTILVKTGKGVESLSILQKDNNFPSFVAENLFHAFEFIIAEN